MYLTQACSLVLQPPLVLKTRTNSQCSKHQFSPQPLVEGYFAGADYLKHANLTYQLSLEKCKANSPSGSLVPEQHISDYISTQMAKGIIFQLFMGWSSCSVWSFLANFGCFFMEICYLITKAQKYKYVLFLVPQRFQYSFLASKMKFCLIVCLEVNVLGCTPTWPFLLTKMTISQNFLMRFFKSIPFLK